MYSKHNGYQVASGTADDQQFNNSFNLSTF